MERVSSYYKLPPALLYAIMRQESHFAHDATSTAGAVGLMQLLPKTAKNTANKEDIDYDDQEDLLESHTNILLGAAYFKRLLSRYDGNVPVALAAYNAGPRRVDRWLIRGKAEPGSPIWIDTIPWHETRDYIKNIVTYYVIYREQLNKPIKPKDLFKQW